MILKIYSMKNILFLLVLLVSQFAFGQWADSEKAQAGKKAQMLLEQAVELKDFVGVTAGLAQGGTLIWKGGAGWRDRTNQSQADGNMLHRTASIAKPMTAVAILQLVEQGKLDLDAPIQNYLPEFPRKPAGDITTRQLLRHTSGIKPYKNSKEGFPTKHYPSLLDAMATFQDRDLAFAPGTNYLYTTYGYVVLGAILEKVAGISFGDYMQKYVFEPANMTHTDLEIAGETYPNKAQLYSKSKNKFVSDTPTDLSLKYPGGGFHTTVEDLLNFGQAILTHQLVSAETFELMITDSGMKKQGNPYGMGWFLYGEHPKYGRLIGHSGSQSGTSTQLMILLDQGIVAATLSNTAGAWNEVFNITRNLYEMAADEEKRQQAIPQVASFSKAALQRYEGKYQFENGKIITLTQQDGYLLSKASDRPDYKIYPQSATQFFMRTIDAFYEFELNQAKQATKIMVELGGKVYRAKRIK